MDPLPKTYKRGGGEADLASSHRAKHGAGQNTKDGPNMSCSTSFQFLNP